LLFVVLKVVASMGPPGVRLSNFFKKGRG